MTEYVVIAGLSGAGRTEVSKVLEDLGWFVVDNLPPSLIAKVAELAEAPGSTIDKVALVVGTGRYDGQVLPSIGTLRDTGSRVRVVFLEAATESLVRRYESTRRRHPFAPEDSVAEAIAAERAALDPVKEHADVVIDTSAYNVHQLKERVAELFAGDSPEAGMRTRVLSFGYKHGLPLDVDLVIDCRFLPNPHWVDDLRTRTGLEPEVREYVMAQPVTRPFLERVEQLLELLLPLYVREGKSYLTVAFGCTGGHHRSVVISEQIASSLRRAGYEPSITHRDIAR
jgi:UPF0042 nucleotide-binding protein